MPGALIGLTAGHTVDNFQDENPIINVNITLPRTATIGAKTLEDLEAVWTDRVELEADWSAVAGAIDAVTTTINVTAGQGIYFKVGGFYKIENEIVGINSILVDALTVNRGQLGTTAAAHADLTIIRFFARVLRGQFTGTKSGLFVVTVTIPNDEKVAARTFEAWGVSRCDVRGPMSSFALTLALPAAITDLTADPRFQKVILRWSELAGSAYRYEIYHATTGVVQINDPDPTTTGDTKLLDRPLADHQKALPSGGEAVYTHEVVFATGVFHHYGVRAVDVLMRAGVGDTVGPLQPDETAEMPAPDVTGISATEGLACVAPGIPARARAATPLSLVTLGFTKPSPLGTWKKVNIYLQQIGKQAELSAAMDAIQTTMPVKTFNVAGEDRGGITKIWSGQHYKIDSEVVLVTGINYSTVVANVLRAQQGTAAATHLINAPVTPFEDPILVAGGQNAPLSFKFNPVGNVTLYFVSVATDGTENDIFSSPNLTVELDGQASPPLEVQNLFCQVTEHGAVVHWSQGLECDLDHYDVADMGNVTALLQSDIGDERIIGQVQADPGGTNKAFYLWNEVLFEGSMSGGGPTIVMPVDTFVPNGHDGKSLQFAYVSGGAPTETKYTILDTTANTIVLTSTPTETGNDIVRFYIGSRTHKFYVRAVNTTSLASEWRPIEGEPTVLQCTVLAPDGSHDIGVSKLRAVPPGGANESSWTLGAFVPVSGTVGLGQEKRPGTVFVQLIADGEEEAETNFDDALKRSIGGIIGWEVKITHSGGNFTRSLAADTERLRYFHFLPGGPPLRRWVLQNDFFIEAPNMGITAVEARVRNFFGWSLLQGLVAVGVPTGTAPFFTGNSDLSPVIEETQDAATNNVYPNLSRSLRFTVPPKTPATADITFQNPEYRGGTTAKGSGVGLVTGEVFYVTVEQPTTASALIPFNVSFNSNYKGVDGKPPDRRVDRYTTWGFEVLSATKFRCVTYISGDL